ncbi:unnamed protein product [Staurois parvus]|uniref:Uncharacterized protein n=1 Tax=Staurois parvus TaxID=386267 RepID=A0ABN9G7F4_9NEOB|nr:unnamed protein product [Staurois parvus]
MIPYCLGGPMSCQSTPAPHNCQAESSNILKPNSVTVWVRFRDQLLQQ